MAVFFVGGEAPQPVSAQQRLERRAQRSDGIGHLRLGPQFENEDRSRLFQWSLVCARQHRHHRWTRLGSRVSRLIKS